MSKIPNPDPIRNAWQAQNYEQCIQLMALGATPTAATLRSILAPRRLIQAQRSRALRRVPGEPATSTRRHFAPALAWLLSKAPQALASRRDILGDMLLNGSLDLAGSTLAGESRLSSFGERDGEDELLALGLGAAMSLRPGLAQSPAPCWVVSSNANGRPMAKPETSSSNPPAFWTLAERLPPLAASLLLKAAPSPLPARQAWEALFNRAEPPQARQAMLALAEAAQAPTPRAWAIGMVRASGRVYREHRFASCEDSLDILRWICQKTPREWMESGALVGAASSQIEERALRATLNGPQAFDTASSRRFLRLRGPEWEEQRAIDAARAWRILHFWHGAATLAADFGLGPFPRIEKNSPLGRTYQAIDTMAQEEPQLRQAPLPLGLDSLTQALEMIKFQRELELATPAASKAKAPGL